MNPEIEPEADTTPEEYAAWCKEYYAEEKATKQARWKYVRQLAKQYPQGVPKSIIESAREMFKDSKLNFESEMQTLMAHDDAKSEAGDDAIDIP